MNDHDQQRNGAEASAALYRCFDRTSLEKRVFGKRALMRKMVQMFLDELPQNLADIDAAVASADSSALERSAHRLKGSAATLSAPAAAAAAAALELAARSADMTGTGAALAHLQHACAALAGEFARLLDEPGSGGD
jgi:HPt (histidine-containing phosphotransfer) domain-containing protein